MALTGNGIISATQHVLAERDLMASSPLKDEFQFYLDHQSELVKKYEGQVVVIKGGRILGAYADELMAITETQKSEELGTFLVQKVSKGDQDYTETFHSRVVFS